MRNQRSVIDCSIPFTDIIALASIFIIAVLVFAMNLSKPGLTPTENLRHSSTIPQNTPKQTTVSTPPVFDQKALKTDWWHMARDYISQRRHDLIWQEKTQLAGQVGAWHAPNQKFSRYTSYFTETGLEIISSPANKSSQDSDWSFGMHLITNHPSNLQTTASSASITADNNRIEYDYGNISEWYINGSEGIEQGLTIHKAPTDKQEKIRLQYALTGNSQATANANGHIIIKSMQGKNVLEYGKLKVTDATGKTLPATLSVAHQTIGIDINTDAAQYPIVVDPLITDPNNPDVCNGTLVWCVEGLVTNVIDLSINSTGATIQAGNTAVGWVVASAGDVNGDGYSDVIVGDPYYINPDVAASTGSLFYLGRVYLYHGSSAGLDVVPSAIITLPADRIGIEDHHMFGATISTAGDVNNDGFDDIIIGATIYSVFQNSIKLVSGGGAAFVYFGGSSGLTTNGTITEGNNTVPLVNQYNWIVTSDQDNSRIGSSVANAGDVNGDGIADIIIGEPGRDNVDPGDTLVKINAGAAHVYYGPLSGSVASPTVAGVADWRVESYVDRAGFGRVVATAGDVNGDLQATGTSVSDVIITASRYDAVDPNTGVVYPEAARVMVFHGSNTPGTAGLPTTPDPKGEFSVEPSWWSEHWLIPSGRSFYGDSVSSAGDINGDGYDDIVIGAFGDYVTEPDQGAAYVYLGSAVGLNAFSLPVLSPGTANDWFGYAVAGVGDINDDGYDDILIGSPNYTNENVTNVDETNEGAVYLYQGSPGGIEFIFGLGQYTSITEGNANKLGLGSWLAGAGDVNNDGYSDVLIGASDAPGSGRAVLHQGAGTSDLSVTVSDNTLTTPGTITVLPGNPLDYVFTVHNYGPNNAHGVYFRVALPSTTDVNSIDTTVFPSQWQCAVAQSDTTNGYEIRCPSNLSNDIANISIPLDQSISLPVSFASAYGVITTTFSVDATNIEDSDYVNNEVSIVSTINTPPQGGTLNVTGNEDPITPITDSITVTDPDIADSYFISVASNGNTRNGQLTLLGNGVFTYTPNLNYFGSDSFSYVITDALGDTGNGQVSITIDPVNDRPSANAYSFAVAAGATYIADGITNLKLTASDIETASTALVYSTTTTVLASGSSMAMNNDGSFTFSVPVGTALPVTESFNYIVTDDDITAPLSSDPATITVSYLGGGNNPPVAYAPIPNPQITKEDTPFSSTLSASDDNSVAGFVIDSPLGNGIMTGFNTVTGAFTYQPNKDYFGSDSFSFHAVDGSGLSSNIIFYLIEVAQENDPPTAAVVQFTVLEDSQAATNPAQALLGKDIDNGVDQLVYNIGTGVDAPTLGTATLVGGNSIQYVPYPDNFGVDSFKYVVTDNAGASVSAEVVVTITATNDAPTIPSNPLAISTQEDSALSITLDAIDIDPSDTLRFAVTTPTDHGSLTPSEQTNGVFIYQPNTNFNGQDTFAYTVSDDGLPSASASGIVNIQVTPENDPPTASNVETSMLEDSGSITINLAGDDVDLADIGSLESIKYSINSTLTGKGGVTLVNTNTGQLSYSPNADISGQDTFSYTVTDSGGITASALVTVTINPVNDRPYFEPIPPQTVFLNSETEVNLINYVKDLDLPPDTLTFSIPDSTTTIGTVSLKPGAELSGIYLYSYIPDPQQTTPITSDSFTVHVNDGQLDSDVATVNVNIINQQGGPVASDMTIAVNEDESVNSNLLAVDIDGPTNIAQYVIVTDPVQGLIENIDNQTGEFTYTPNADYFGQDQFSFKVLDQQNVSSNIATVTLAIQNINDLPNTATIVSEGFGENGGDITLSATDIDNDALTFELDTNLNAVLGTVNITSSTASTVTIRYDPIGKFGQDVFGFKVSDNNSPVPGVVYGRVYVSINKDAAVPPTPPELIYPVDQDTNLGTDVDLEWSRSTIRGQHNSTLVYHVEYCDKSGFVDCLSGNNIAVPTSLSDFRYLAQATSITLGGSSFGLLMLGLLGSRPRRKHIQQAIALIFLTITVMACSEAAKEADASKSLTQPKAIIGNIQFQLLDLQPGTEYFWRVTAYDESTGILVESNIHRFTTAP